MNWKQESYLLLGNRHAGTLVCYNRTHLLAERIWLFMKLKHNYIETNGVRLHVVQAGPKSGIPVILLHGFPEFWYGWSKQIPALAEAGCRVIVPDQRGYNLSDK